MTGYTEKQADRIIERIDRQTAKACEEVARLFAGVTDHAYTPDAIQSDIKVRAAMLKDIVRRRRR